ncbi:serine/threonine protein kinase, STE family, STE20-related [Sarocladium strictum]
MASLQVRGPDFSVTKQKALEDAKKMQKVVAEECNSVGKDPPPYQLSELIGKGSFGRVYKATAHETNKLVAVKIINIEEGDTLNPKMADTYSDLLKEINALKLLRDSGAKNINHVIEAVPVGQSMWVITEYCAGGSVATLMKPTAPDGLQERWIIPILREVAEAMKWVHGQGIIHRDLKCANVLVTEVGDVQLCDFGVAGVVETKFDKRTTVIGTPHWMAPELFDNTASYGMEVDIWAFGAMVFEMASGLPPNAAARITPDRLGSHLKSHTPRLDGDQYTAGLKDLVSFCLHNDPRKRPTIEQIQRHRYLFKSEEAYPTSGLSHLVRGFKLWESQGGDRRSLFAMGGAQGPSEVPSSALANDEWNFSTTATFDQQVLHDGDAQDFYDVYGSNVDFHGDQLTETARPQQKAKTGRRRPPPQLPTVKAPLEKLFDPNTMSSYDDNSRLYYGRPFPLPVSDLPLRDDSASTSDVRESLIDLDASLQGSDLSQFVDLSTIRAGDSRISEDYDTLGDVPQFSKPPLSDPADMGKNNRRTQDWKFPSMAPPASANPEMSRFPFNGDEGLGLNHASPAPRPPLIHHPTEPTPPSTAFNDLAVPQGLPDNRVSMSSLIDLDMSMPDPSEYTRPSTSHSDVVSISGSEVSGVNPFELEKHASLYASTSNTLREPSIYVSDSFDFSDAASGFSASEPPDEPQTAIEKPLYNEGRPYSLSEFADTDPEFMSPRTANVGASQHTYAGSFGANSFTSSNGSNQFQSHRYQDSYSDRPMYPDDQQQSRELHGGLPPMPNAPSPQVMQGQGSHQDVKEELRRLAMSLGDHLSHANAYMSSLPVRKASSSNRLELPPDEV